MLVFPDVHMWPPTFSFPILRIFHLTGSTALPHTQRRFIPQLTPSPHPSFKSPYAVDLPSWISLKCTHSSLRGTTGLVPNSFFTWITVGSFPTSLPVPLIYYMSLPNGLKWTLNPTVLLLTSLKGHRPSPHWTSEKTNKQALQNLVFGQLSRLSFTFCILSSTVGIAYMFSNVCTIRLTATLHMCCCLCLELHFPLICGWTIPLLPAPCRLSLFWFLPLFCAALALQAHLSPLHILESLLPDSRTYVLLPDTAPDTQSVLNIEEMKKCMINI